jgi:peptidoglycan/xylan/chitin deacetylase (PgdA/CDA1 family)
MVALTFDDGPTANTPLILEVLKRNNAVATFFVVGSRINSYPNTIQDIIASGSEIGNHTWSHRMMTKLNDNELIEEIVLTNNAIYALTNTTPTYVRPPYGMVNGLILKKFPHISFAMWSVDTLDWKHKNGELTLAEIENSVYDGAIILMHDLVSSTAASMEDIVQLLTQKGYQLVTVSEMCEYRNQTHQKFRDCKP